MQIATNLKLFSTFVVYDENSENKLAQKEKTNQLASHRFAFELSGETCVRLCINVREANWRAIKKVTTN